MKPKCSSQFGGKEGVQRELDGVQSNRVMYQRIASELDT